MNREIANFFLVLIPAFIQNGRASLSKFITTLLLVLFVLANVGIADDQSNPRFTESDINDSAMLSFKIPLGNYKGRGMDLPISLNYSSDLWKMEHIGRVQNSTWNAITQSVVEASYSKYAMSGWRSSLALPIIEFPKSNSKFDYQGKSYDYPSPHGCLNYFVREVYIHMPDGSTHTLRKTDEPQRQNPVGVDYSGRFYAVDGSRMRFDANGSTNTGTIYMPDGTRYVIGTDVSYIYDRHGVNVLTYAYDVSQQKWKWTDTLGREIPNLLPSTPTVGEFEHFLPGLAGYGDGRLKYVLKWELLQHGLTLDAGGNAPPLKVVASEALPNPNQAPSSSNYPAGQGSAPLFKSTPPNPNGTEGPEVSSLLVGKNQAAGQLFNPVVLTEIVLPDQTKYKFSYNVYGELDRIVYPTSAFEKYEYSGFPPSLAPPPVEPGLDREEDQQPYLQSLRWISKRQQGIDEADNNPRTWLYFNSPELDGGGFLSIVAPDGTRTEIVKYGPGQKDSGQYGSSSNPFLVRFYAFGNKDAWVGMVRSKKFLSAEGGLLRQEVYEYTQTTQSYQLQCMLGSLSKQKTHAINRTPRLTRKTDIIFEGEGGPALAQSTTFLYDLSHQYDTGIDLALTETYDYVIVSEQAGINGDLSLIPLGTKAKSVQNNYWNTLALQEANILGLSWKTWTKNGNGTTVSRSEITYDECPTYCVTGEKGLPTSLRNWDSTKGSDPENPVNQIVTHAKFDEWGNRIEATDAIGTKTITAYDSVYHAFPISVTTSAPDPYPSQNPDHLPHGSQSTFVTTNTYDTPVPGKPPLGLVTTITDINGQETTYEYEDPLLRPTKVTSPNSHQAITEYGMGTTDATRWMKVRTQIDASRWVEVKTFYDGLGRNYKTQKTDSSPQGDVFTLTCYDVMGRVQKISNPFYGTSGASCSNQNLEWTTSIYDDLSRTKEVITPDGNGVQVAYGLSTSGDIGTTKTNTDQAGRTRRGILNALGQMIRVDEPDSTNGLDPIPQGTPHPSPTPTPTPGPSPTPGGPLPCAVPPCFSGGSTEYPMNSTYYVFDVLGNLRKVIQGSQSRYFRYDSLGRVIRAKQPEQDVNLALAMSTNDPVTGNNEWSAAYEYDDNGNITKTTDARNVSISGYYDRINRLIYRNYSDTSPDVGFFYDGTGLGGATPNFSNGKTTKIASTVSETRNTTFDSMGRVTSSEQRTTEGQISGTQAPYTFAYAYNLSGSLIEETYPSGRVVKNTLNADGKLSQVQSKKNGSFGFFTYGDSFDRNAAGEVIRMQLGNGRWETAQYDDERQQITQIGLGITSSDQALLKLEFKYKTAGQADNNGSMREQKITVPAVGVNPTFTATQTYAYDSLNRLQSAREEIGTQTWKQTFSYDRYGNRRFDTTNGNTTTIPTNCPATECNPDIDSTNNQLSSLDGYEYDENGALKEDGLGRRFRYDAESRQKEFFAAANQTENMPDATYHYDGEGRRIKKVVGTEVTIFVYDASGQLAAEYSTTVVPQVTATVSYLTADHLGSPRVVTDQNGVVISRKDFTAFGEEVVSSQRLPGQNGNGYNTPNIRQDYTGYQQDGESGLEFAEARYYTTSHGRFTSVDPLTASSSIRDPQTFNRYSYVTNSPYKFVDPLGLARCNLGRCIQVGGGDWFTSSGSTPADLETSKQTQTTQTVADSDIPEDAMCNPDHPYWNSWYTAPAKSYVEGDSSNPIIAAENAALSRVLTDGGVARVSKGATEVFHNGGASHFRFPDGQIIGVHVYTDQAGSQGGKLFIPDGFEATYHGGPSNTVTAYNKDTKDLILILHVKGVKSQAQLNKNMRTTNAAGSKMIGQVGGPGGDGAGYIHSCLKIFRGWEGYRRYDAQYNPSRPGATGVVDRSAYSDFRRLIK